MPIYQTQVHEAAVPAVKAAIEELVAAGPVVFTNYSLVAANS